MTFFVGQKVIFVGSGARKDELRRHPGWIPNTHLKIGAIYTVRDYDTRARDAGRHPDATVRVEEFAHPAHLASVGLWEPGFMAFCFRPVTERKTDISIFTKMLTPNGVKQNERV